MKRLLVDVNSIAKAAANGLPFCGTAESEERVDAFFHLLSETVRKYAPDQLFLISDHDGGAASDIRRNAGKSGLAFGQCDCSYDLIRYLVPDGTKSLVLTADRAMCVLAGDKTEILMVGFTSEGSGITEVTEPLLPDQIALESVTGEEGARTLLLRYGSLDAMLNDPELTFFGEEKKIKENSGSLKGIVEKLKGEATDHDKKLAESLKSMPEADISGRELSFKSTQAVEADTSAVIFLSETSDDKTEECIKKVRELTAAGKAIVFYDLKALLHALAKAAGFPEEIRRKQISEENNGQMSMFHAKAEYSKKSKEFYDLIMDIEKKAWEESLEENISYGKALHRYFEDVKIEGYLADPLKETVCCDEADVARAHERLSDELVKTGQETLYEEMELPLVFVLYDMEKTGIYMESDRLYDYGKTLGVHMESLEKKIYEEAGEKFNINSPKQLGEILFGKLGLPKGKKTKTGYSTSQKVLDELAGDYPIVEDVLSYRKYAKLKSTYADGLFGCVSEDGRVHTTYQQTVTATGRLSSTDPNLQNIPIRLELGKQIRKVFLPAEGSLFLDADYSQIELRVLAHMSEDGNLIEAYRADKDIHTATAAAVFHVSPEEVTPLQRRSAKAVNFGIVYGISSFGLGANLSISRKEAQQYINDYFKAYPLLHSFLDRLVDSAKIKGYARTMYGRRRPVPELKDSQYVKKQFGERVAMNAPIQGSAADIIKIAMLNVFTRLRRERMKSKLLLQVHDELLIEAPESEKEEARKILKEEMENAAVLRVPLEVDLKEGYDWYSAH